MKIFDQVKPETIEQRELHLWILALAVIFIMTLGMALLMYPAVFEHPVVLNGPAVRKAFIAFCTLSFLMLGYFIDRQVVIRQLRKRLAEEGRRVRSLRQQASMDMLAALPGLDRFQDALAMEFRRAFNARQCLSLVTVAVRPRVAAGYESDAPVAYGDALKALARKLRKEDSLYHFGPGVFGIVLPGVPVPILRSIAHRLTEGLQDASGVNTRFDFEIGTLNYPTDVQTAREMEEKVRTLVPGEGDEADPTSSREMALASN